LLLRFALRKELTFPTPSRTGQIEQGIEMNSTPGKRLGRPVSILRSRHAVQISCFAGRLVGAIPTNGRGSRGEFQYILCNGASNLSNSHVNLQQREVFLKNGARKVSFRKTTCRPKRCTVPASLLRDEGWICLDFFGFSRQNLDFSMSYADKTRKLSSYRFCRRERAVRNG
jgi:hypothetical protein